MQEKKAEIDFFDHFVENSAYDVFNERGYKRIVAEFLKYLKPIENKKNILDLIDLGCGTGAFTSRFQNSRFQLYAMDISSNCIKYAQEKYPFIKFKLGDIENTKFDSNKFDAVFLSGVLHHFPDFSNVLKECYRILKPGGILLAYDPHKHNPFMWAYRCEQSPFYSSNGITKNERLLKKDEISKVLSSSGFSKINIYSISGVTYKYFENKFAFLILPIYNFIERLLDIRLFRERFGSFLITYAQK